MVEKKTWNGWSSSGAPTSSRRGPGGRRPGASPGWWPRRASCAPGCTRSGSGVLRPAGTRAGPLLRRGGGGRVPPGRPRWARRPPSGWPTGSSPPSLAARAELIVPPGGTADFLAPWSVATLARPDLAVTLQRLGVTTLGQFAALPAANVSDRFGADAAACHAVARGESGELAGLRDRGIERRLRVARGEDPDRGDAPPPPTQPGFFGGASEADLRAARSFVKVQERLGIEAVLMGGCRAGGTRPPSPCWCPGAAPRPPPARSGAPVAGAAAAAGADRRAACPAAGRAGRRRGERHGGERARPAARRRSTGCRSAAGPGSRWWAGPVPGRSTERWWSVRRRRARLQVVTADGVARLLCTERGQWWVEALYD